MTVEIRESMQTVQEVLLTDPGAAPPLPYTESAPRKFGTDPIPLQRYISPEFLRLEYERLWPRVWQWACNKEDIPNVGDHLVYDIGRKSVLVVRSAPDEIRAYYNACLHRGRQLKTEPGNNQRLICGFHGWTWNLDGSLAKVPCHWDFPQMTPENAHLPEVRVETWSQFVFINFDDDAKPLSESLDMLPEHFKHFPLDDTFTAAHVQKVMPANWKVTMEAFLESYHEVATHPQLLEWNSDANTQYDIWNTVSRLFTLMGVPSPHLGGVADEDVYRSARAFYPAPGSPEELPDGVTAREAVAELVRGVMSATMGLDLAEVSTSELVDGVQYWVFPNWCPWSGVANGLQYRFRPNGNDPDSSIFDIRLMLPIPPGAPRPSAAPLHVLQADEPWANAPELMAFCEIMQQDEANLVALQRGLHATKQNGVNLSEYQESRIRHFHALLDQVMA